MGKRRTRILIETDEILIARNTANPIVGWCPECQAETEKLTAIQAALLCGVDRNAIEDRIHSRQLHVSETPEWGLLICLASLGHHR